MKLMEVLNQIRNNYDNQDIRFLASKMEQGNLSVRKQLADMVCRESSGDMSAAMIHEISKWGVNDDLSQIKEIRSLVS